MKDNFEKLWVSQKAILIRNGKILILRIVSQSGSWDLPGGRIDIGEKWEESFRRELKEELGIDNFKIIGVVDYGTWYTLKGHPVCGIVNMIESKEKNITISKEHTEARWITIDELDDLEFTWKDKNGRIG